eukprot:CAMPEP_0113479690 /NCGR_PEP_ID=MMETSP0014_2-20120614/21459_1 /TAXON_ID=2857 /ORGANISM="Nitzschia sp." /LENGTH=506 /DNA_ID=CAMNT_0000373035 /DNA_START=42 /DNA_END=1562 /DNA_ORIENTATION=- /assembly_acc=CAM_ASM_000159
MPAHHRRGLVGHRRALKKSFGGKTGVWWRADDDNGDSDHHNEVVGGGGGGDVDEVDDVDDVNNGDAKEETVANTVVEGEEQEAHASDGNIETSDVTSTDNADGDENLDEDEEQEENSDDDGDQQQQQQQNTRKSCWDDLRMGWDDDLCRPIYYHGSQNSSASSSSSSSAHGSRDSDSDGEEGGNEDGEDEYELENIHDEDEHGEDVTVDPPSSASSLETPGGNSNDNDSDDEDDDDEEEDLSVEEEETMPAMKKRRRNQQTFGRQSNKRRAIASLIVMDHESEEDEEEDISTSTTSPGSEPTTTTTTNRLAEEVEDIQKHNNELQTARRISTSPLRSQSTNGDALDDANIKTCAFDFIAEDAIDEPSSSASKTTQSRKGKKSTVNRVLVTTRKNGHKSSSSHDAPNPRSSLDDARDYFAKLDETHSLTLDSSETPVVSSRITRTIRGVDLTSPGLHVDYETYVEATVDSGVTPLPIEHFASSRRINLRQRGDLFDGFLDVDVAGTN